MTVGAILTDPTYPELKAHVLNRTGLAYYESKDEDLAARLSRRIGALKVSSCAAYLAILNRVASSPSEIDALVGELTIGETYFFRQNEHFELLRSTIIPDLLRRNGDSRQLRIWSAGCATGAEPYSVAILIQSEFAERTRGWEVLILGTDINMDFLAQARAGSFTEWALRDVPREARACCFRQQGKRWMISPEFRDAVTFRYHNLADDLMSPSPDGMPFDVILCRNVMIYFSPERTRAVATQFFRQLTDGGWLLVGHAESNFENFPQFDVVRAADVTAYRKPTGDSAQPAPKPAPWQPWDDADFAGPASSPTQMPPVDTAPPPSMPASISNHLEDARMLADRGEWHQAEAICRELLAADTLNAPARFTLGLILAHTKSPEAATAELRRAIYVDRQFALAYYHLGTLLQAGGNLPEARKAFRNAIRLLQTRPGEEPVEHGDGIRVAELRDLTRMHQEVLGE